MKSIIRYHDGYFAAKFYGDANIDKIWDLIDYLLASNTCESSAVLLGDFTELNASTLEINDLITLKMLVEEFRSRFGQAKLAILVSRDLEYAIARMWMTLIEDEMDLITGVFRSRKQAISWLKNTSPKFSIEEKRHRDSSSAHGVNIRPVIMRSSGNA